MFIKLAFRSRLFIYSFKCDETKLSFCDKYHIFLYINYHGRRKGQEACGDCFTKLDVVDKTCLNLDAVKM